MPRAEEWSMHKYVQYPYWTRLDKPIILSLMKSFETPHQLQRQYRQLSRCLTQLGLISQGSVQDRTGRQGGGAGYQWTRKVKQKTVTVALTPEQFTEMKKAIGNYRKLRSRLQHMEKISRRIILQASPHPNRRKRLSKRVLGVK